MCSDEVMTSLLWPIEIHYSDHNQLIIIARRQ